MAQIVAQGGGKKKWKNRAPGLDKPKRLGYIVGMIKSEEDREMTKKLVIVKSRGTPKETRTVTDIPLYWSRALQRWVTIPQD